MLLKVGTRPSRLALKQVEEVRGKLPYLEFDTIVIKTKGDKDKITPLTSVENTDFFTHEIEQALLKGEIDVAVHSAKDLEEELPEELKIAAMTKSVSQLDCLVSTEGYTLETLPEGATIGTSSKNRKEGIRMFREDLITKDIRGNVDDRLEQLDRHEYDAIIVAQAALIRLGFLDRPTHVIPTSIIKPHPLQGRLAIEVRKDRQDLIEIFKGIHEE